MKILLAGGGTGGHLFPALALAEAVKARGGEVLLVGSGRKVEELALSGRDFSVINLSAQGLVGRPLTAKLKAFKSLLAGLSQARRIIRSFSPQVVFGVGGYASFPVLLAAKLSRLPTVIHEQNSIPGLANRFLGRLVKRVFVSFPFSRRYFPRPKTILSGNPVRPEVLRPVKREHRGLGLLVTGGSQGARFLNRLLLEMAPRLLETLPHLYLVHQTGFLDYELVSASYRGQGFKAQVSPFFRDMAWAYAQADLVLCRAGATTIAELAALGKPAILVPFPHATHGHQEMNARLVAEAGGGLFFREKEIEVEEMTKVLLDLLRDKARREEMARQMKGFMPQNALEIILSETEAMVAHA